MAFPESSAFARQAGFRAVLCVPLLRDGVAIGSIAVRRTEAQRYGDTAPLELTDQDLVDALVTDLRNRKGEKTTLLTKKELP